MDEEAREEREVERDGAEDEEAREEREVERDGAEITPFPQDDVGSP